MRRLWVSVIAAAISTAVFATELAPEPELSAAQIVEKNVAARGGLEAWRKIQTMVWVGHIERANAGAASMPYVLEQKRPNKTHFEINAQNQVGVRVFDGIHGWKLRPASNGRPEVQPYTAEELNFARDGQGIDGMLVDYQAKGIAVTLDGVDEVEGRKAYRLSVMLPSGVSHHVWIDAQTFLDVKYDRQSRDALGRLNTVAVFYRNYQPIDGLQIPRLIESGLGSGSAQNTARAMDKMVIDKILLNPPLEEQRFAKPRLPGGRNAVLVDTGSAPAFRPSQYQTTEFPGFNSRQLSGFSGGR
jgi:hypothetical protein